MGLSFYPSGRSKSHGHTSLQLTVLLDYLPTKTWYPASGGCRWRKKTKFHLWRPYLFEPVYTVSNGSGDLNAKVFVFDLTRIWKNSGGKGRENMTQLFFSICPVQNSTIKQYGGSSQVGKKILSTYGTYIHLQFNQEHEITREKCQFGFCCLWIFWIHEESFMLDTTALK